MKLADGAGGRRRSFWIFKKMRITIFGATLELRATLRKLNIRRATLRKLNMSVTKSECSALIEALGNDNRIPYKCDAIVVEKRLAVNDGDTHQQKMWPKLARRVSNLAPELQQQNWLGEITVSKSQCNELRIALAKFDQNKANDLLPKACGGGGVPPKSSGH